MDTLLRQLAFRRDIPHAILAVESGDRSFRWASSFGVADDQGSPMRPNTPFFLASVDKMYTACVVLRLWERGLLRLENPIAAYLPEATTGRIHRWQGKDYSGAITVWNLLSHTSGLPDWHLDRPKQGRPWIERLIQEGDRELSLGEIVQYVRVQLAPHFPPQPTGSGRLKTRYCDTNFLLLNALIEEVTGRPLAEVHEHELFRRLGLSQTWLAGHSRQGTHTPEPAALWSGGKVLTLPRLLGSLWGIYSTAEDGICFLRALLRGECFHHSSTLVLMQRWNRLGFPLDLAALRSPHWPIEYGLGMPRFRIPRIGPPLHLVGHSGSTGRWLFYCPQQDLFLAGSVDQVKAGPLPYRFLPGVLRAVQECARPWAECEQR
ncbi:MAG: serine hydrolase domain-containing protein [Bryobacteraceae bacterium]